MEILQLAGSLGVGAFLGLIIFLMYRSDRKSSESRLTKLLQEDQKSREENTKALSELTSLLNRMNGRIA